jgi:hypothetical protein
MLYTMECSLYLYKGMLFKDSDSLNKISMLQFLLNKIYIRKYVIIINLRELQKSFNCCTLTTAILLMGLAVKVNATKR